MRCQKNDTNRVLIVARTSLGRCDRSVERLGANSRRSDSPEWATASLETTQMLKISLGWRHVFSTLIIQVTRASINTIASWEYAGGVSTRNAAFSKFSRLEGDICSTRWLLLSSDTCIVSICEVPKPESSRTAALIADVHCGPFLCSLYYNFDQHLFVDSSDPTKGWGLFGRAGRADKATNPIGWFLSAGVGRNSMIPRRSHDTFETGYYYAGTSSDFGPLPAVALGGVGDGHGTEPYYNIPVTDWFRLTADAQFITPAREPVDSSVLLGMRGVLAF